MISATERRHNLPVIPRTGDNWQRMVAFQSWSKPVSSPWWIGSSPQDLACSPDDGPLGGPDPVTRRRFRVGGPSSRVIGDAGPMPRTIATVNKVDNAGLLEFIRPRHHLILTTRRLDGSLQSSPVSGGVDPQGRIVVSSYPERAKVTNIRRDPRVSVLVLSDDFGGPWVQVETTGTVIDLPEAVEPLVEYFRSISGEHPDWAEYRQAMIDQGKCLLRLEPVSWGPIATGGFPARLA